MGPGFSVSTNFLFLFPFVGPELFAIGSLKSTPRLVHNVRPVCHQRAIDPSPPLVFVSGSEHIEKKTGKNQ